MESPSPTMAARHNMYYIRKQRRRKLIFLKIFLISREWSVPELDAPERRGRLSFFRDEIALARVEPTNHNAVGETLNYIVVGAVNNRAAHQTAEVRRTARAPLTGVAVGISGVTGARRGYISGVRRGFVRGR